MLRNLLTALVAAILLAGLLAPAMSSSHQRASGGGMGQQGKFPPLGIRTFSGPDVHERGHDCYGCHTTLFGEAFLQNRNPADPQEPCLKCHEEATPEEVAIAKRACNTRGAVCPIIIAYDIGGRRAYFFFGNAP